MSGCDRCNGGAQEGVYSGERHGRLYLAPPLGDDVVDPLADALHALRRHQP